MDESSFYLAKIDLEIIAQRILNSLEEIKKKDPTRLEYINPMTNSLNQIKDVIIFLNEVQISLEVSRQRNIDLEIINLLKLKEIEELKNKIKFNNLDL